MNIFPPICGSVRGSPSSVSRSPAAHQKGGISSTTSRRTARCWLHVLRSPHAHAKIVSIDTIAATGMPSVKRSSPVPTDQGRHRHHPTLAIFQAARRSPMAFPPRRLLAHEGRALCRRAGRGRRCDLAPPWRRPQRRRSRSTYEDAGRRCRFRFGDQAGRARGLARGPDNIVAP